MKFIELGMILASIFLMGGGLTFYIKKKIQDALAVHIRGTDTNTGEPVDFNGNAIAVLPKLLIENAQQSRQAGAAIESFRNEMVKANEVNQKILMAMLHELQRPIE